MSNFEDRNTMEAVDHLKKLWKREEERQAAERALKNKSNVEKELRELEEKHKDEL